MLDGRRRPRRNSATAEINEMADNGLDSESGLNLPSLVHGIHVLNSS